MSGPKLTLQQVVKATNGLVSGEVPDDFKGVHTDSRSPDLSKALFIPLEGDRFDGHDFVVQAVDNGAAGVVYHKWLPSWEPLKSRACFIYVPDTLVALQNLGAFWRSQVSCKVIGISGSNGKTSTKDFTAQILESRGAVTASRGSFNNHWGVPLSLLEIRPEDRFAVLEMGMNHPGELTVLNRMVKPHIVCVTNVGRAHMGFFKNVEAIADAKEELYVSAPQDSVFIFNKDNSWTRKMASRHSSHRQQFFSMADPNSEVFLKIKEQTLRGYVIAGEIAGVPGQGEVSFWGSHNIENLAAASCICLAAGMKPKEIWQAFPRCHLGWGRNQWLVGKEKCQILFDGYNANPESFRALWENLKPTFRRFSRHYAVFGEMLELGEKSADAHFELGQKMAELPWAQVGFFGASGTEFRRGWETVKSSESLITTSTYEELLDLKFINMVSDESLIIVKGSRGQRLERFVSVLEAQGFSKKS